MTGRPHTVRAAVVQLNTAENPDRNRERADALTRAAAMDGAELVVLPEKWNVLGTAEQIRAGAEPLYGPSIAWAREAARELGIELVAGSIVERVPGRHRFSNTSVHVDPTGEVRAVYRKIHLFDVEVDGTAYRESDLDEAGSKIVTTEIAGGIGVGLAICYDLRFPELFRAHVDKDVRIVALPSAFTLATTREHWDVLVRARAIENQTFVLAANQVGLHQPDRRCGGRSLIVDPWGVVLACVPDGEGYAVADLDLVRQEQIRARLPALRHRRADLLAAISP
jgi:predicted amidohydrolase